VYVQGYSGGKPLKEALMPFLILFEDAPGHDTVRAENMADHLAFLARHGDRIQAAGPLFDGDAGAGGAWVVDCATVAEAQDLVRTDPFWPTGLRKSVQILHWKHVFASGSAT
jgi:uncharacterized protein